MYEVLALIPQHHKNRQDDSGLQTQQSRDNRQKVKSSRSSMVTQRGQPGPYENLSQNFSFFAVGFAGLKFIKWPKEFWLGIRTEFPMICGMAPKILLSFYTIYLCNVTFSALTIIGTKYP